MPLLTKSHKDTLLSTQTHRLSLSKKLGLILLLSLLVFAFFQPVFHPIDSATQDLQLRLSHPSIAHPFGTDHLGRDMLSRLASSVRLSLIMAITSVLLAASFGLILGILAGFGGWLDKLLGFVCDIIMALPGLLFVLLFAAIAPNSFWSLYLGIALVMWVEFFKMSRAISQTLAQSPELQSSFLMQMGILYAIRRHFLPKILPILLPLCAFAAGNAVLALATLGFVNVGLRPPTAELGLMMTELFPYYREAFFVFVQPVIVVFLLVLAFLLLSGKAYD